MELNAWIVGNWAYDAVTALATAAERIMPVNYARTKTKKDANNLKISMVSYRLLKELTTSKFRGLTGD